MATIQEIEKQLELKLKTLKKLIEVIKKQEKLLEGLEKQEKALKESGADKSKDKKVKDNYKNAQTAVATAKKDLEGEQKAHELSGEAIATLNDRLRWLTTFVESREGFATWWDKEEAKMATLVDKARDLAQDAEEASTKTEKAADKGDMPGAQAASQEAAKAAKEATAKAEEAEKLYSKWGSTWDVQRNLKSSHMPKEDVASYAALTKKVYEIFRIGQNLMVAARRWDGEATRSAEAAAEFVASGGDLLSTYGKMLDATIKTMHKAMDDDILEKVERGWGKVIMEEGKQFVTMRQTFEKNPEGALIPATKMVEQAEGIVPGQLGVLRKAVATLEQQQTKVLSRIPAKFHEVVRYGSEHKDPLGVMRQTVEEAQKILGTFEQKFDKAVAELNKLKKAVES